MVGPYSVLALFAATGCGITEKDSIYRTQFDAVRQEKAIGRKARYYVLIPGNTTHLTGWCWKDTIVDDSVYTGRRDSIHLWIYTRDAQHISVNDSGYTLYPQDYYMNTTYDTAGRHMATFWMESADSAVKLRLITQEQKSYMPRHTTVVPYLLTIGKTWQSPPYFIEPFADRDARVSINGSAVVDTTLADQSEFKPYKIGGTWYYNGAVLRYYYSFTNAGESESSDTIRYGTVRTTLYLFKDIGIVAYECTKVTNFYYPDGTRKKTELRYNLDRSDDPQKNPFSDKY